MKGNGRNKNIGLFEHGRFVYIQEKANVTRFVLCGADGEKYTISKTIV